MKITRTLLFLCLISSYSVAGIPFRQHENKITPDTVAAAEATIEDKLKIKDSESVTIQNHFNDLFFKEQLDNNSDILRIFPEYETIFQDRITDDRSLIDYEYYLLESRLAKDRKKESDVLKAYGNFYALRGDLDKSISFYKEALLIKEELNDKPEIIKTSYRLGNISKYRGHYDDAVRFYENVLRTAAATRSTAIIPQTYLEIALIKGLQVKNGEAEYMILKKALPLFTRQGNRQGRVSSFQALAGIYHNQNRYSEAKWFYIQANTLARKINDKNDIITSLVSLANVKYALGHYELALKDYQEAEQLAAGNKNMRKLVEVKSALGDLYYKMGNLVAADKEIDEYAKLKISILGNDNHTYVVK